MKSLSSYSTKSGIPFNSMMKYYFTLFLFLIFASELLSSPLNHNVQFPTLYIFLYPKAETADIPERLKTSFSLDHTSIHIDKSSDNFDVLMDMEYTTLTSTLEYSVTEKTSFLIEIPVVSMNDGFLDKPLADYHDAGNFPDYGRSTRPDNEFVYYIRKNGEDWFYSEKGGVHLTDITLGLKRIIHRGDRSLFSLSYRIKLPTGDYEKGFGSGEVDHGIFVLSKHDFDNFIFYLNFGHCFIEEPKTVGGDIETNNITTLFTALEYLYSDDLSFIVQINGFTNHIKNGEINNFENDTAEGTIGFSLKLSETSKFEFSFSEDLTFRASAPDFTFQAGVSFDFGS